MVERAKEYMEKINIRNINMLWSGIMMPPHMDIIKACKEITLKHGYHLVKGKEQINRQALNGKEKLRCELFDANRYMLLFLE